MIGHAEQCVEIYLELSNLTNTYLNKVTTPCIDDHALPIEDFQVKGQLAPVVAIIVLKCLDIARLCRMDILWTVNSLARKVTKWTVECDKILHILIAYIHHTSDYTTTSFCGRRTQGL